MPLNLSDTNAAFSELLRLADGQINLVERALIEATRDAHGKAPTFSAVKAKLVALKQGIPSHRTEGQPRRTEEFA